MTELRRAEEQLRVAQKMEAVGQLAGGVAHDFNNLLSVILSYAQLTRGDLAPNTPIHNDIGEIEKAAKRAANLTRQLLAFSRRQVFQVRPIALPKLVAGVHRLLTDILGERITLNHAVGFSLICGGAFFVFKGPLSS